MDQLVCLGVPPTPVYKGERGGAAGQEEGAPGGVLLPPGVGFPSFLVGTGEGKGEGERRKGAPPLPSPIRTSPWGRGAATLDAFLSFPVWPNKAQYVFP